MVAERNLNVKSCWMKRLQQPNGYLLRIADMITGGKINTTDLKDYKKTYVTKWIDYSNKFGFGYQLNDNSIGVIFNDGLRIKSQQNESIIITAVSNGTMQTKQFNGRNVPKEYRGRNKLLQHFKQYMEENLADSINKEEAKEANGRTRKKIFCTQIKECFFLIYDIF